MTEKHYELGYCICGSYNEFNDLISAAGARTEVVDPYGSDVDRFVEECLGNMSLELINRVIRRQLVSSLMGWKRLLFDEET